MTYLLKLNTTVLFSDLFIITKSILFIPPLLINDKFATDIKAKASILNKFFVEQCTPLKNDSSLPISQHVLTLPRLH